MKSSVTFKHFSLRKIPPKRNPVHGVSPGGYQDATTRWHCSLIPGVKPQTCVVFGRLLDCQQLPGNAFTCQGETDEISVYFVLLVSYTDAHTVWYKLRFIIRMIHDCVNNVGVEANAEIPQQGELTTSDEFTLLEKTLFLSIIGRRPFVVIKYMWLYM